MQMKKSIKDLFDYYSNHVEFIGDPINSTNQVGVFGSQMIHLAAFRGFCDEIETLLASGADIDATGDLGLTPLHYAVLGGQCTAVKLLIHCGANHALVNEFDETPLQMADLMLNVKIKDILQLGISFESISSDKSVFAKQRWEDFKNIQELNFPTAD
jgi:uncharacterized protein